MGEGGPLSLAFRGLRPQLTDLCPSSVTLHLSLASLPTEASTTSEEDVAWSILGDSLPRAPVGNTSRGGAAAFMDASSSICLDGEKATEAGAARMRLDRSAKEKRAKLKAGAARTIKVISFQHPFHNLSISRTREVHTHVVEGKAGAHPSVRHGSPD